MTLFSPLLILGAPLQVLPMLAEEIGLNEAIVLQQLHYSLWLNTQDPTKAKTHFKEDRWWTFSSDKEWQAESFPFWRVSTVTSIFARLEDLGYLVAGPFNTPIEDCRRWRTIDYAAVANIAGPVDHSKDTQGE